MVAARRPGRTYPQTMHAWENVSVRVVVLLLLAGSLLAAEKELKHDSGDRDGRKSRAGTGHVITFRAPRGNWWIRSISVHGARYGGGYDPARTPLSVTICDARLERTPYRRVQPEGIGTPPDVPVAYQPDQLARDRDPVFTKGRAVLAKQMAEC